MKLISQQLISEAKPSVIFIYSELFISIMKRNFNLKLVALSSIALAFLILTFTVNPYFIIGAVIFMFWGQKEMKKWKGRKNKVLTK